MRDDARAFAREALAAMAIFAAGPCEAGAPQYKPVPGGSFASVVAGDASGGQARVDDFLMREEPVTRGEFARFVDAHREWGRDAVPGVFADADYLSDDVPGRPLAPDEARQPVVHVSWFAAQAYCESEGARLPTWNEWEYAAAADETRRDARGDPLWRERILVWYAHPAGTANAPVGGPANMDGVRDLHGLVWEWVDDFNALLVDADSRSGNDPDKLKFCGAGAINLRERDNYAILMRVALLSSLKATDGTGSLGFRCVRPGPKASP